MTVGGHRMFGGRYRVDGLLGTGGMSEVFHGHDERLDRRVAVKVLRRPSVPVEPDSPEAAGVLDDLRRDQQRFLREIRTTARLEHPGIPAVYDTGVETLPDGNTQLWLVMQLLRGSSLQDLLDHADYDTVRPSIGWAAAVAAQIAAVLADVHRVDIVHRDIKPANVMIVDGGLVKVLDFGIAILRGTGALPRLTQVDRTVGTPPYMSPEQCLGQPVTAASDVYSLGCLLHELLTGDQPFHESSDMSLRAHHLQTPPPSVRTRRPDVPEDVDALVISMLAKQAPARPSAEAVYDVLAPLASTGTPLDDGRDPTRPFRRPLLAPPARRSPAPGRPALGEDEFEQLMARAEALLDDDRPAEAIGLLEDGLDHAGQDRFVELRLRHFLAAALYFAGEYTRAAPLYDAVGRDYLQRLGPADADVLDCFHRAGHAYAELGDAHNALPHLLFYVHHAADDEPDEVLGSRFAIAQMYAVDGRTDDALTELAALRGLLVDAYGPDSTQVRNLDRNRKRLDAEPDAG